MQLKKKFDMSTLMQNSRFTATKENNGINVLKLLEIDELFRIFSDVNDQNSVCLETKI